MSKKCLDRCEQFDRLADYLDGGHMADAEVRNLWDQLCSWLPDELVDGHAVHLMKELRRHRLARSLDRGRDPEIPY